MRRMRRKRNFWAKCIAVLLIVVMVLCEQNITTLGETIGSYAQERLAGSAKDNEEEQSVPKSMSETGQQQDTDEPGETATEASTSAPAQDSGAASQEDTSASEPKNAVSSNSAQSSGQDVDAKQGQNAQKQDEEQKEEEKIVSNDTQETKTKQKKAAANQQTNETDDEGEKDTAKAAKANETYLEAAERYYGENGTMETATVSFKQWDPKEEVLAGQTVDFEINYKLAGPAYFNYKDQEEPLFDSYKNTKIVLHLPEGLEIDDSVQESLPNGVTVIAPKDNPDFAEMSTKPNDWVITLEPEISVKTGDITKVYKIPIKVINNGVLEAGHEFLFGTGQNLAEIKTKFTIMDRTGETDIESGKTYQRDIGMDANDKINENNKLVSITNDEWIIQKTAVTGNDGVVVDGDNEEKKVTVKFNLTVGLKGTDNGIITEPALYGREGRVPFERISLQEMPTFFAPDGTEQSVQPNSITITPNFGDKKSISLTKSDTSWDAVLLPVDTCAGKNVGDNVEATAPYRSTYTVEMVYDYDTFVSHYYDPLDEQGEFRIDNKVKLTYTLKGVTEKTSESSAEQKYGEVTEPAKLVLEKKIFGYEDNTATASGKPYTLQNYPANGAVTGPVEYTITRTDGVVRQIR